MKIRKEIHTRCRFAKKEAEYWFERMINAQRGGGNVVSCIASDQFVRAKRIYDHYRKEFGLIAFPEIYD